MDWILINAHYLEETDKFIETYKNWKIYLTIPNGGILGVGVSNGTEAYVYASEKKYYEEQWHIEKAKKFLAQLIISQKELIRSFIMNTQILENGRVAVTQTFRIEIPPRFKTWYWEDGKDWADLDPDWENHLMLCSSMSDPLASICKDASQQEVEQFLEEVLAS